MTDNADNNGKVTLAVLAAKMDRLQADVQELLKTHHQECADVEVLESRTNTLEKEVDRLRSTSNAWNAGNTAAAIIAGVMAGLGLRQP